MCEYYVICRVVEGDRARSGEMMEWHILTHSLIGNCVSVWCDDREGYEVWMTHLERTDGESCVEERGYLRYFLRAGVISRNEGEEGEELFVWMVFLHLKAHSLSRVTVVREGMSACEDRVIGNTLQSDGTRIEECATVIPFSSEWSEFRQVYSSVHFIITTSHDQFSRITMIETECMCTKLNGSQFRQV